MKAKNKYDEYRKDLEQWETKLTSLPYDEWPSEEERPQPPDRHAVAWKISALFDLAVGRGLDQYRGQVIRHLCQSGTAGERVWKQVIGSTSDMERHMQGSNYSHLYPTSLDGAASYYNLNLHDSQTAKPPAS